MFAFNVTRVCNTAIDTIIAQFIQHSTNALEYHAKRVNESLMNGVSTISFSTHQRELMDEIETTKAKPMYQASDVEQKWAYCLSNTIHGSVQQKIDRLNDIIIYINNASTCILDIYIKCDKYLIRPDINSSGHAQIQQYKSLLADQRMQYHCIEGELQCIIDGLIQYNKTLNV